MIETAITLDQFIQALHDTLVMVSISLVIGSLIGIPLGILLVVTRPGGLIKSRAFYNILNPVINIIRSLPFIILMVAIIPLTRLIVNTTIGTPGAIVPLIILSRPILAGW